MVFACVLEQRRYFNVEADNQEQMMDWLQTHDLSDVAKLTRDYSDSWDERICDTDSGTNYYRPHFSIATKYYPVYSKESDMTFIMKETENEISVSGFYYGTPVDSLTEQFKGSLTAEKIKMKGE